jgi:hypothetical protein
MEPVRGGGHAESKRFQEKGRRRRPPRNPIECFSGGLIKSIEPEGRGEGVILGKGGKD